MVEEYIRLQYASQRRCFEVTFEEILNSERMQNWLEGKNKYVGFYESVIEYIATYSEFDQNLERMLPYYRSFLYTDEEIQRIRKYGEYLWNWAHALHPKAEKYEKKHGNYDYVYLTDPQLPEILEKTKELYDHMKANDEKYDFARSLKGSLEDPTWYDEDED